MKKNINVGILIFTILCIALTSACAKNKTKTENETTTKEKIVLNDRQKKILEEEELPTDYEELDILEKSSIESIEDFLEYLENKYGKPFCYDGYVQGGFGEEEQLMAYSEDDSLKRIVTATREYENDKFVYKDDYQNILVEETYKTVLKKFINQYLDEKDYKLFVNVNEVDDDWTRESIVRAVKASRHIFLNNTIEKNTDIKEFIKKYGSWMKKQKEDSSYETIFLIQKRKDFDDTNEINYKKKIYSRKYLEYISCSLDDGKLSITNWE